MAEAPNRHGGLSARDARALPFGRALASHRTSRIHRGLVRQMADGRPPSGVRHSSWGAGGEICAIGPSERVPHTPIAARRVSKKISRRLLPMTVDRSLSYRL